MLIYIFIWIQLLNIDEWFAVNLTKQLACV